MSDGIDRRSFILHLAALGATVVLPGVASAADVDEAWGRLEQDPWYFDVSDQGTIVDLDIDQPKINSDVYDISVASLVRADDVISLVSEYDELRAHFVALAADELSDLDPQSDDLSPAERERVTALAELLQDEDEGWIDWVESEGALGVARFKAEIEDWLERDVDWGQMEFWPVGWGGQGRAFSFFNQLSAASRGAMGVAIVEGDHPGSTYFAAELHIPCEYANHAAQKLTLPIRFRHQPA